MNQAILNLIDDKIYGMYKVVTEDGPQDEYYSEGQQALLDLKNEISSLPSDTQWIDVKEDPGQAGEYLIFDPEDSRCTDYFIRGKWEYTNPTHWMPLPTPPNN